MGGTNLAGKRVLMFSYGSGLAASIFCIKVPDTPEARAGLAKIQTTVAIPERLSTRKKITPEQFNKFLDIREVLHNKPQFVPEDTLDDMYPGTFYLSEKDSLCRRVYKQTR